MATSSHYMVIQRIPYDHNFCVLLGFAVLTAEQQQFNKSMSSVRESVEWVFGNIITNFAFLDFKKNLQLLLQPVGKYYLVGTIFTNCHTCLYGSQTSDYFNVQPPELEDYLGN